MRWQTMVLQRVARLIVTAIIIGTAPSPGALAQEGWPLLVVNDAATANPELVPVTMKVAGGMEAPGTTVMLPPGFQIELLATGLNDPRFMAFDPQGNLLVAGRGDDAIYRYEAGDDGKIPPSVAPPAPLITGLHAPSNVAFYQDGDTLYLYVGETDRVTRFPYDPNGPVGEGEIVIPDLPTGGHSTRTVAFGPDGKLYLAVGSSCNICVEEDERRAAVLRYNPDGSGYERFAWGLRNPVGLAFQPGTDLLWATVNERDHQGNEVPPDLVTIVVQGADYGWPYCQPPHGTPQEEGNDCSHVTPPTIGIQAHSAPLGLAFATSEALPKEMQGDLFVVQHGSWNREPPAAPKILRIDMEDGTPVAAMDFAMGWQDDNGNRWGRPAGIVMAPDGSIIVSDDDAGVLYRITYTGA
ncbi:MAG: L-sorbosone dehydrogenase [Thermomicrobiales bacterium]|nr:MAG: L-sorbosone dehydrogenase [Thermomicrobiales bacterium]